MQQRWLFLFYFLMFITLCAYAGDLHAPGTFDKLQHAIDAAHSGDTVIIAPGEYTENLILKNGVSLVAKESGKSIIHAAKSDAPALLIDECLANTIAGIVFTGPTETVCRVNKSYVTLQDCTFSSGTYGLELVKGGPSTVRSCKAVDNTRIGIFVRGSMTSPTIEHCTCSRNGLAGIFVAEQAHSIIQENTCSENGMGLIGIGKPSGFTKQNIFCANRYAGSNLKSFLMQREKTGIDIIHDNGEICSQEIAILFEQEEFAKLETIARRLREKRTRNSRGAPELREFYQICDDCGGFDATKEEAFLEKMNQWETKYPQSITRRIVLASSYHELARRELGDSKALNATSPSVKKAKMYLTKADAVLEETRKLSPRDPEFFRIGMYVCYALGKHPSTSSAFFDSINRLKTFMGYKNTGLIDQWFTEGIQYDPDYNELYTCRAQLLDKSTDKVPGAIEEFARKSADNRKGEEGDILYALIAWGLTPENYRTEKGPYALEWVRIKRGIEAFLTRYPEALEMRHHLCRLACIYDDKETAAKLFTACFENSGGGAWKNEYQFNLWNKWALKNEPRPIVQPVQTAILNGDIDTVRQYLDTKGDIDLVDETGHTLLASAVWREQDKIVRLLLERGCDVNKPTSDSFTPLSLAINRKNNDIIDVLLKHKANFNLPNEDGFTPFMTALANNNLPLVLRLLAMGADPNRAVPFGLTPLNLALKRDINDIAMAMIEKGAKVNACDFYGDLPLIFAAEQGKPEICNYLLEHSADPKGKDRKAHTVLGAAAKSGHLDVVKLMLEKGSDPPEYCSPDGWSILHSAVDGKSKEVVAYLLERIPVVALDQVPAECPPILHYAIKAGNVEIVQLFLNKKPSLNLRDKDGKTPLSVAIAAKNDPMIALLRAQGATE